MSKNPTEKVWPVQVQKRLTAIDTALTNEVARETELVNNRKMLEEDIREQGAVSTQGLGKKLKAAGLSDKVANALITARDYTRTMFSIRYSRERIKDLQQRMRDTIKDAKQGKLWDEDEDDDISLEAPSESEIFARRKEEESDEEIDEKVGQARFGKDEGKFTKGVDAGGGGKDKKHPGKFKIGVYQFMAARSAVPDQVVVVNNADELIDKISAFCGTKDYEIQRYNNEPTLDIFAIGKKSPPIATLHYVGESLEQIDFIPDVKGAKETWAAWVHNVNAAIERGEWKLPDGVQAPKREYYAGNKPWIEYFNKDKTPLAAVKALCNAKQVA